MEHCRDRIMNDRGRKV